MRCLVMKLYNSDGRQLSLASDLLAYLSKREPGQPFRTGNWLRHLDAATFEGLKLLADEFAQSGLSDRHDDILLCAIVAQEAELSENCMTVNLTALPTTMNQFATIVAAEDLHRLGWIELVAAPCLDPAGSLNFRLTELGKLRGA